MAKHVKFLARTVMVENGDVMKAYTGLHRVLTKEKIIWQVKRQRFREKPYQERNRLADEKVTRMYEAEMDKKLQFLLKKNRPDPHYV